MLQFAWNVIHTQDHSVDRPKWDPRNLSLMSSWERKKQCWLEWSTWEEGKCGEMRRLNVLLGSCQVGDKCCSCISLVSKLMTVQSHWAQINALYFIDYPLYYTKLWVSSPNHWRLNTDVVHSRSIVCTWTKVFTTFILGSIQLYTSQAVIIQQRRHATTLLENSSIVGGTGKCASTERNEYIQEVLSNIIVSALLLFSAL